MPNRALHFQEWESPALMEGGHFEFDKKPQKKRTQKLGSKPAET